MGNDLHTSDAQRPVLAQTPLRLDDEAVVAAPPAPVLAEPRPISISLPSSFAGTGGVQPLRVDTTSHLARTVPIASPSADMSTLPTVVQRVSPGTPSLPKLPNLPNASTVAVVAPGPLLEPELVEVVQAVVEQEESRFVNDAPPHPMAHLMPQRTKPTEAQVRANELRAAKKKKARRAKLLVVVAVVAIGALAGPPLAAWIVDAINESGTTTDRTEPSSNNGTGPDTRDGVGSVLDDIDTLTSVVAENNADG